MFEICIAGSDLLTPDASGETSTGGVWVVLDSTIFPGQDWQDFPVSVVGSAVDAVRELTEGATEAWSYFFDGPFYLYYKAVPSEKNDVYIEANTDSTGVPKSLATGTVPLLQLRRSLQTIVDLLIELFAKSGNSASSDVVALKKMAESLRA